MRGFVAWHAGSDAVMLWLQHGGAGDLLSESARLLRAGGWDAKLIFCVCLCTYLLFYFCFLCLCSCVFMCLCATVRLCSRQVRVERLHFAVRVAVFRCYGV